eukprot:401778-Rhodomonas_salina.4
MCIRDRPGAASEPGGPTAFVPRESVARYRGWRYLARRRQLVCTAPTVSEYTQGPYCQYCVPVSDLVPHTVPASQYQYRKLVPAALGRYA